jgi:hypothetical protein
MYVKGLGGKKIKLPVIEENYSIFGKGKTLYDVAINSFKVDLTSGITAAELQQKYYEGFREGYVALDILVYEKTSTKPAAEGKGISDIYSYEPLLNLATKQRIAELELIEEPTLHQQQQLEYLKQRDKRGKKSIKNTISRNIMSQNTDMPTPVTITDNFVLASRKGLQKWGPEESIKYIVDLRTENPIPRSELLPENYKISDFMTLPQFVPGPKSVALVETKMQEDIAQGFSQALTIQREERRIFRKFDVPELPQNWDEAVLTVLQEKMRTSGPQLTPLLRKEIDKFGEIEEANETYFGAKEDYLENQKEYNERIEKLEKAEDVELAAKIKLQQLEEEERKASEYLKLAEEKEKTAKKKVTEKLPKKKHELKKSIEESTRTLKDIFIQEMQSKYPTASTKQLYKQFIIQNNRPKGLKISGDEYIKLLIENVIIDSDLEKFQTPSGSIKRTTVFGKLIDQLREENQLSLSDRELTDLIKKRKNELTKYLFDEDSNEELPTAKNPKSQLQHQIKEIKIANPTLSPHKAKTKAKSVLKHQQEEEEILEKAKN